VRFVTWNIHRGIGGLDRRYAPGRLAAVLRHYDADVLVLQEVDDGVPRSSEDRQVDLLADLLDYPYRAYGPNVWLKRGCYGNATLSRYPIARSRNVDITFPMKKARGALFTELEVPVNGHRYTVHVLNIHLGLSGVERRWQVRKMLSTAPLRSLDHGSRIVLAGDTNDWSGALPRGQLRQAGFECVTGYGAHASRTFPAWGPVGALDRVFIRGGVVCERHFSSRLALARRASDHLPIVVDLEVEAG
jgi:endonuclease/exonuclease/phosphatase family metal-dependent hydrolase